MQKCRVCGANCLLFYNCQRLNEVWSIAECQYCGCHNTIRKHEDPKTNLDIYRFQSLAEQLFLVLKLIRYRFIIKHSVTEKGRIIDWGCGRGEVLQIFRKHGWRVTGVEYDEKTSQEARNKNLEVILTKSLSEKPFSYSGDENDVALAFHFLEHVEEPLTWLKHINESLKDNGVLILEVPNINSWQRKLAKRFWIGYDCENHFVHFSAKGLETLLAASGFDLLKSTSTSLEYGYTMSFITFTDLFTRQKGILFSRLLRDSTQNSNNLIYNFFFLLLVSILSLPLLAISTLFESIANCFSRGGVIRIVAMKSLGQNV